jgi:FKBP-type peptidyl-prolyl cis-trans isomerase
MHMTRQYRAAGGRARNAAEKTADFWTRGARAATDLVPGVPRVDLVPAVERYFELVQRTVDINRRLTVRWAQAVGTLSGAVREKAESAGDLAREKAEAADNVMREQAEKAQQAVLEQVKKAEQAEKGLAQAAREQAEKAEQAAREQAQKAEQAEQGLARQARQAEREQARRAHKRARERYEGLTKAELSDQLAKRELPKTGNVDALIERLVEADSK